MRDITGNSLMRCPSLGSDEERKQHEQRKRGASLRENQWVDGDERRGAQWNFPVKTARPRAARIWRNAAQADDK